ncbi:hypothetical protein Lfu02_60830 [Longispora fulva]|uniref:Uncharacterized protein n=1 Tax=Longispora fulva TaxID=619741 RepID=A0A8J7GTI2_9ACTN|nr:hypothetical protein [Longispora fulva]MBG6136936.1 hypothetical protein [Longispora fulva]GIG61711.1 hypothetical protein Lfu02_60830 [Longispora fulva]
MSNIKRLVTAVAAVTLGAGLSLAAAGSAQAATPECVASFQPANGGINPAYVAYTGTITCLHSHRALTVNVHGWDASKTGNFLDVTNTRTNASTVSVTLYYAPSTPNWGFTVDGTYQGSSSLVAVTPVSGPNL